MSPRLGMGVGGTGGGVGAAGGAVGSAGAGTGAAGEVDEGACVVFRTRPQAGQKLAPATVWLPQLRQVIAPWPGLYVMIRSHPWRVPGTHMTGRFRQWLGAVPAARVWAACQSLPCGGSVVLTSEAAKCRRYVIVLDYQRLPAGVDPPCYGKVLAGAG